MTTKVLSSAEAAAESGFSIETIREALRSRPSGRLPARRQGRSYPHPCRRTGGVAGPARRGHHAVEQVRLRRQLRRY
jgi:hypothetical protein